MKFLTQVWKHWKAYRQTQVRRAKLRAYLRDYDGKFFTWDD